MNVSLELVLQLATLLSLVVGFARAAYHAGRISQRVEGVEERLGRVEATLDRGVTTTGPKSVDSPRGGYLGFGSP